MGDASPMLAVWALMVTLCLLSMAGFVLAMVRYKHATAALERERARGRFLTNYLEPFSRTFFEIRAASLEEAMYEAARARVMFGAALPTVILDLRPPGSIVIEPTLEQWAPYIAEAEKLYGRWSRDRRAKDFYPAANDCSEERGT